MASASDNPWLSRFAAFTAVCTLFLICVGGVVTSKGVGMAVPDWPTTYGYNMFFFPVSKWVGGIREEHSHRLVASAVGLLTTILALWLFGRKSRPLLRWGGLALLATGIATIFGLPRRLDDGLFLNIVGAISFITSFVWPSREPSAEWLRRLGLIAFIAVVFQGILGGLRVAAMKDEIGIFHAVLAQLFFCLICAIALFTSRGWRKAEAVKTGAMDGQVARWAFLAATVMILAQLVLGATMRHQHAGLAIPDFPTAYGKLWPATDADSIARYNQARIEVSAVNPITAVQVGLQMVHRVAALLIAVAVAWCAWLARRRFGPRHSVSRLSLAWFGTILMQIFLGAATIWTGKSADIATAHVAVGALSLVTGVLATIIARRGLVPAEAPGFAWREAEPGPFAPTPATNVR